MQAMKLASKNQRLDPYARIRPKFDNYGLGLLPVTDPGENSIRVSEISTEDYFL